MITEGSLQDFSLPDLLQIAALQAATGTLTLHSEGRSGRMSFREGKLLAARLGDREGKNAACDMFLWQSGVFDFTPDVKPEGAEGEPISLEEVSQEGMRQKERWDRISEQLPGTFSHRTWIVAVKPLGQRSGLLAQLQSGIAFAEFARLFGQGELAALEEANRLVQTGDITLHSSQEEQLRSLFNRATDELFSQFASISGIKMIGILETQLNDLARERATAIRYRQGKVHDNLPDTWNLDTLLAAYRPLFLHQQEYVARVYGTAYVSRVLAPMLEELSPQQRAIWDKLSAAPAPSTHA